MTMLPTFIGVGGKKCGSTWLSECLREHPEIFMSSPKEINFFSGRRYKNQGLAWYQTFFPDNGQFKAVGEFSPDYLHRPGAPKRIYETLGDSKIIILLRNPLDRFLSDYKQAKRSASLPDRHVITLDEVKTIETNKPGLIQYSFYSKPVERYLSYFTRDQVLILNNEQFSSEPQKALQSTFQFLEVEPEFQPFLLSKTISAGGFKKFPRLEKARIKLHDSLKYTFPKAIDWVKQTGVAEYYRKANTKQASITLASDAKTYLNDQFLADLEKLSYVTGIKFNDWKESLQDRS